VSTVPPALDRRLLPTAGVLALIGDALVDALLLPFRVVLALLLASRRKREIAERIEASLERSPHAAKDEHPPR
jgi:hypothetical protein